MKRIFLFALGACALGGNLQAETVLQQMGNAQEIQAQVAVAAEARQERQEAIENAQRAVEAQALAKEKADAELKALEPWFKALFAQGYRPHDRELAAQYDKWLKHNAVANHLFDVDSVRVTEGDPVPFTGGYDDAATIRVYLHDSGYSLSDAQIQQVSTYMHTKGIKHVSELGQSFEQAFVVASK